MIDVGLLASIAILVIVPAVFVPPWPPNAVAPGLLDVTAGALAIGVAAGRVAAVAIDDPGSLTNVRDLLVVRSGVEFWVGALAGLVWIAIRSRHDNVAPAQRLAAITAPALVAWACYEATCVLRDGCPGPLSSFGLRPEGLVQTMVPVGLFVALAAGSAALLTRWLHRRGLPDLQVFVLVVGLVATIRAIASVWLPHVGNGLTRQHVTSIVVSVAAAIAFLALRLRAPRTSRVDNE